MKTYIFSFFFLVLCSDSWAQLTCTNCTLAPQAGSSSSTTATVTSLSILTAPGTFTGSITLTGNSQFVITGTGQYVIEGVILQSGTENYGFTLTASSAGDWGGKLAGLLLKGSAPNTYGGTTIVNSGYIACSKSVDVVAIPGEITMKTSVGDAESGLWFGANGQLSGTGVLSFDTNSKNATVSLNGTTQSLRGVNIPGDNSTLENINTANGAPTIPGIDRNTTAKAVLLLTGTDGRYIIGGSANLRGGGGGFEVRVQGTSQVIQNFDSKVNNVTFNGLEGSRLELSRAGSGYSELGENITFKGAGNMLVTGTGAIAINNSTLLKSAGQIRVSGITFRNNGDNNIYSNSTDSNKATLLVDADAAFDLYANVSIFDGLTGGGIVQNSNGSTVTGALPGDGYSWLTLGENNSQGTPAFDGIIRDNSEGYPVAVGNSLGGIALKKVGTGTQVLKGVNRYTGRTTVSSGRLKLQDGGQLENGTYGGALEIANATTAASQAVFEHNGTQTQIFTGPITNTGEGGTKGIFLQSGTGKSLINGAEAKAFTGQVNVTGGFLGGTGNLTKTAGVSVAATGSIGGGDGVAVGGTLTVSPLSLAAGSKLVVTATSGNAPSLVWVKDRASQNQSTIAVAGVFTIDLLSANLVSGRIIGCTNGSSGNHPMPVVGQNNTGKPVGFTWGIDGLYVFITQVASGLACNNCSFSSGGETKTGTSATPALILSSPGTFTGDITLNGDCQFTLIGAGNYTLSGQIMGNHSLTLNAPGTAATGYTAGLTLAGAQANSYGSTTINSGYLICNKTSGVPAIPGNVKLAGSSVQSHLWCLADNQLSVNTVVDFTGIARYSYFDLNGTTQTIVGLVANTDGGVVENTGAVDSRPAGMTAAQVSDQAATLNINAGTGSYTYGGGAYIRKGGTAAGALTVNMMRGTQIIQNPDGHINNVTFTGAEGATPEATLEFNTSRYINPDHTLGTGVTFGGGGTIKITGNTPLIATGVTYLKTAGKFLVSGGTWQSRGASLFTRGTDSNKATLLVEEGVFSINNASIFSGLTGSGDNSFVQNDWGEGDGYADLTINQNNTATLATFGGAIKDNHPEDPVSTGEFKGGIRLRKEGVGIQVLTGPYTSYTGSTTVSAGTLKLGGGGKLGKGTYGGVLEIANASAAATQATFEHNGTQAQVFTGNITNTGTGDTKGKFLQSGSGKSIINGAVAKSFSGHVNITGGFLGGSGDLRNATSVTVAAGGSIGGGDKVAANGGTLTVANLTFAAADSKLIVTSTSGSTPGLSLVEVKAGTGAGTVTATAGFTVEVVGTNLVSGYILKCSNGTGLSVPTLVLPADSPMAGKVRLSWDSQGLWMQISVGTITIALGNVNMVCPKGTNPDNPRITVTATYSSDLDLPPQGSPSDYFTLSPGNAKSGTIDVNRVDRVVTAVFDGANTTTADLSYTITYDDHRNLAVTSGAQKINRQPTLSTSPAGGNSVCLGTPLVLQAAGNGTVTISSSDTGKATVSAISATFSATATTLAPGNVNFWAADGDGCRSNYLAVEVGIIPVIGPPNPAICKGTTVTLTADHEPAGVSTTTPSAWVINPANDAAATLEDQTATDRTVSFRAKEVTAQTNVTVEYTDNHGCKGTTTVVINTELTLTQTSTSPICRGTKTDILLNPSLSNTTYTWTVNNTSVGAQAQATAVSSNRIAQELTNSGDALANVTYTVTGTSGTCVRAVDITVGVSHTQGVKPAVTGGGQFCAGPENKTYQTNLIPSVEGTNVTWTYTSVFPKNQTANVINGNTQKLVKGTLTDGVVKDNLVLSGNALAEVRYVFRPFISCLGTPSDTVSVKIHPVPVAGPVANSAICSSSETTHPKTNIVLSSTPAGAVYTWTVDKTNSADVTGYSEPSRGGATVPTANPEAAKSSPITDPLSLTASKGQTIRYSITPWHSGCPGKAVMTDVTVHPRPVLTVSPPTASICIGSPTAISLSTNLSEPEKNHLTYSWEVKDNTTTGAHSSSANQPTFEQETLSLNADAANGSVTYTFTPVYAASTTLSCAGQLGTSVYTVIRPATVAAGTITDRELSVKDCFGDVITLNATPADTHFLWLKDGIVIPGATGNSYVVPTNAELKAAKYAVAVANACGERNAKSGEKEVTVTQDAYFTGAEAKGPENGEGETNKPVNFTYTAPNVTNTEYSWDFKDSTPVVIVRNPSHTYLKVGTYHPTLKVTKLRQSNCFRDFELAELKIKEGVPTGDPNNSGAFSVYPIPAQDRLTIVNDNGGDLQNITIRDIRGKTVMSEAVNGSKAILSIAHFANGIYLLTVTDSKGVKHMKISKN